MYVFDAALSNRTRRPVPRPVRGPELRCRSDHAGRPAAGGEGGLLVTAPLGGAPAPGAGDPPAGCGPWVVAVGSHLARPLSTRASRAGRRPTRERPQGRQRRLDVAGRAAARSPGGRVGGRRDGASACGSVDNVSMSPLRRRAAGVIGQFSRPSRHHALDYRWRCFWATVDDSGPPVSDGRGRHIRGSS